MLTHRLNRLMVYTTGLRQYTTEQLLSLLRERRYPPLLRAAALRWLINWAPVGITRGAPFEQKRRYVRQHYGI
jgi:hypothetical protein